MTYSDLTVVMLQSHFGTTVIIVIVCNDFPILSLKSLLWPLEVSRCPQSDFGASSQFTLNLHQFVTDCCQVGKYMHAICDKWEKIAVLLPSAYIERHVHFFYSESSNNLVNRNRISTTNSDVVAPRHQFNCKMKTYFWYRTITRIQPVGKQLR